MQRLDPPALTTAFKPLIAQITLAPPGARMVALSGQVAVDAGGNLIGAGDHARQAWQCFENIRQALLALHASPADIFQMRLYVVGYQPSLLQPIFAAGAQVFGADWPVCASSFLGVAALAHPDWLIEVEVMLAIAAP